jgi:hypothetical protein
MKKVYTKPTATFESFMLSSNISAGCAKIDGIETNSADYHSCGFTQNGWSLFINLDACGYVPQGNVKDNFCYDIPTADQRIFGS